MLTHRLRLFYLVFFGAGMPALIYQVAWQRVLTLYFGVDIYSTCVTVATFMLGLGLGSLLGGVLADRVKTPALYYAATEAAMGVLGLVSVPVFSAVGSALAGGSLSTVIVVDFALLLLPTTLMGMSLPLMCRIVIGRDETIGRQLSGLYSVNTLGAALGALLSSYFLIGMLGLDGATYAAGVLNILLALTVYTLPGRLANAENGPEERLTEPDAAWPAVARAESRSVLAYRWVLALSFLSGFTALGYEIVWYRLLGIILHGTVYVFGTILFVYLGGIALGSMWAQAHIDEGSCVDRFAKCQLGISAYSFLLFTVIGRFSWIPPIRDLIGASFLTSFHPSPELIAGHIDIYSLYSILDIAGWTIIILGVPTVLMGYGFSNLMREGAERVTTLGYAVGGLYCANIIGSTLGSLVVGFVLIDRFGSEHTLRVLIVIGCLMPLLISAMTHKMRAPAHELPQRRHGWSAASLALVPAAIFVFPAQTAILRAVHFADNDGVDFIGLEDRSGVSVLRAQHRVIAFEQERVLLGQQRLYIDGSHHGDAPETLAVDAAVDFGLAAHRAPRRVLSIGLGDGQMVATALSRPEVQELVIVELNGTLEGVLRRTSAGETVFNSKKTRYIVDDGRRWLLANPDEKFDVIMMFPLHAAQAFSGNLFSLQFFEILGSHLGRGGIVIVRTVDGYSTARTVATAFPYVFRVDSAVYVGSSQPMYLDTDRLKGSTDDLKKRISADRETILTHTADARINTDLRPNSEFYVTYPYVRSLQTRFSSPKDVYQASDNLRVWRQMSLPGTESSQP